MNSSASYTDVFIRIRARNKTKCDVEISVNGADPVSGFLPLKGEELQKAADENEYGSELFKMLLSRSTLTEYTKAVGKERTMRIRLSIDKDARTSVAHWNWECLWDESGPLAADAKTPFSRYIDVAGQKRFEPLTTSELRILVTLASPKVTGLADIKIDENVKSLLTFLKPVGNGPKLKVTLMPGYRGISDDVKREVEAAGWTIYPGATSRQSVQLQLALPAPQNYHIWHHLGHGKRITPSNPAPEESAALTTLYLESSSNAGKVETWDDNDLAAFIKQQSSKPYLVFLDACEGAYRQVYDKDPLFGMGPKLVQAGVPAVVAMQDIIYFDMLELVQVFYRQLLGYREVDVAMNQARSVIKGRAKRLAFDWTIPVLFMRLTDGRLFNQLRELPQGDAAPIIERKAFEPETVIIPGGAFVMGSDTDDENEKPQHSVHLPDYRIGKYPVTNAEYASFLKSGAPEAKGRESPKKWLVNNPPQGKEKHPVVGVSWDDANAYCEWLRRETRRHYRLPSEAEWEKAARGTDGRRFPWGNDWLEGCCNVAREGTTAVGVCEETVSPYGCFDLLGNVEEWCSTIWGRDERNNDYPYPYRNDDHREDSPAQAQQADLLRIYRGGSFNDKASDLRSCLRNGSRPNYKVSWRGFRVAIQLTK